MTFLKVLCASNPFPFTVINCVSDNRLSVDTSTVGFTDWIFAMIVLLFGDDHEFETVTCNPNDPLFVGARCVKDKISRVIVDEREVFDVRALTLSA
tara:strand:+ start:360 stop:647 length:288 start_codon:yes stop_codon:yes gene_type:complete